MPRQSFVKGFTRKPHVFKYCRNCSWVAKVNPCYLTCGITEDVQFSAGRNFWVQLPDRPACRVSWIREKRFAGEFPCFIKGKKFFFSHIYFSPDLKSFRNRYSYRSFKRFMGIERIVFRFCVTSSPMYPSPLVEPSVKIPLTINEFNGETVNLYLNDVLDIVDIEQFFYPFVKISYFFDGHGVLEAQHGYCV